MRVIALFGRGNTGKTRCLGHLINLIYREVAGCNYLFEGHDARITLDYLGKCITICTWGDNDYEEGLNIAYINKANPDIAIVATRSKGETVEMVKRFCKKNGCEPKWVEKYVASFDDKSGQEYLNNVQAEQILDYVKGLIKGQLYYVDSISAISDEEGVKLYHVGLLGVENSNERYPRTLSLVLNANQLLYQRTERPIREDDFVLYIPDSGHQFLNGNEEPLAISLRNESREVRTALIEHEIRSDAVNAIVRHEPVVVKSYHVNVGHGNCSLILSIYGTDYELWMVDCSTYDYLNRRDYSQNLYYCLAEIAATVNVNLNSLRVSKFMLTHTHFDHYCGLSYLIKQGLIDDKTLVYANLHYDCASPIWTGILKNLNDIHCQFVEPVGNRGSVGSIHIYHPECTIIKDASSRKEGERAVSKVNNSSVVYGIELGGITMVFPGDLEQKGFEKMSEERLCSLCLYDSDYYVISHHGSINGHPTMSCDPIESVLECVKNNIKKAILMGRDGAYSGIYSAAVTSYWGGMHGVLEYTEKAPRYLVLNWGNAEVEKK